MHAVAPAGQPSMYTAWTSTRIVRVIVKLSRDKRADKVKVSYGFGRPVFVFNVLGRSRL